MMRDNRLHVLLIIFLLLLVPLFSGCIEGNVDENHPPLLEIIYPTSNKIVTGIITIIGFASDMDTDTSIEYVEVKINHTDWQIVQGTIEWSYDWNTYVHDDGPITIYARAWDGKTYSEIDEKEVIIKHPETKETEAHKWAVFVFAGNYPSDNESKLGNGGLYLAEDMASYFIEELNFPTSNIFILFDDGWIRKDNGFGSKLETLQQRSHQYAINYGGATKENVEVILHRVVEEASHQPDSEVFLWFAGHGLGDQSNPYTGGKILERSALFLWDNEITDRELGEMLYSLRADKTCIITDACFSGGFADKLIYDFPTLFVHSRIPGSGRVVMSGASKFRSGFASTTRGPLFSFLWFEGLISGEADGFQEGFRSMGKPPGIFTLKDGKVSVEEAFYYARYVLREDDSLNDYQTMEPQINDQYPNRGNLRSKSGLIL